MTTLVIFCRNALCASDLTFLTSNLSENIFGKNMVKFDQNRPKMSEDVV